MNIETQQMAEQVVNNFWTFADKHYLFTKIFFIVIAVIILSTIAGILITVLKNLKGKDIKIGELEISDPKAKTKKLSKSNTPKITINDIKECVKYLEEKKEKLTDDITGIKKRFFEQSKDYAKSRITSAKNNIIETYKTAYLKLYLGNKNVDKESEAVNSTQEINITEKNEEIVYDNETIDDYNFRNKLYFKESISSSIRLAYQKANRQVNIVNSSMYVTYIDENSNSNLKVQDEILKINNIKVYNLDDVKKVLLNYKENDLITVTVKRNNKEIDVNSKLILLNNEVKLGVSIITIYDYDVSNDVSLKFGNKESGPSGGLMFTLSIYNKLVDEDITKGRKIVGTGTIDLNGNVGEIGGVKYKLKGAVKAKADIFICPYENYDEVMELKNRYNYDIEIIKASTFDEAIEKLK